MRRFLLITTYIILTNIFCSNLIFSKDIFVGDILKSFSDNAFDARKKYSGLITINGFILSISDTFLDYTYVSIGTEETFSMEGIVLRNISDKVILNLNKGDKITFKGELKEKVMDGIAFDVSKVITKINYKEYKPPNSSKKNPISVSNIMNDKEKNYLRAKHLYGNREIYINGLSGKMYEEEDWENNKIYNLKLFKLDQDPEEMDWADNMVVEFTDPKIADKLSSGNKMIISGKLTVEGLIVKEPKIHSGLGKSVVLNITSSIEKPLLVKDIVKDFNKNEKVANKYYSKNKHFVKGSVGSVDTWGENKYVSISGGDESMFVFLKDLSIFDKLKSDSEIIVSGIVQKDDFLSVKSANFEKGTLQELKKVSSSKDNPIDIAEIIEMYNANPELALKTFGGNIFIKGKTSKVGQDYDEEKHYLSISTEGGWDSISVYLTDNTLYPHIKIKDNIVIRGMLKDVGILQFENAKVVSNIQKKKIPTVKTSLNDPVNGEKLIDDFEENSARARLMYVGRIFVSGFSDGVKEVDGSEGTNFYLQLKGTKDDLLDFDYVYIELIDNKQYANIKKGQPIIASGKLGEVRFLGASLEDSKIIIK